jgi:hypothetical protein
MKRSNQKDKDGYGPDIDHIKLEQKEFEMQMKLLDTATKHIKDRKTMDVPPEDKKIKE